MFYKQFENIENNIFVLGADIIELVKKKNIAVEKLFISLVATRTLFYAEYFDALTFLWMMEIIEIKENIIYLKKI